MTHEVIRHLLDDYVTGDLPEDARAPVAEHIAECAICTEEVSSLERVIANARNLKPAIEPPAGAWETIRAAIERDRVAASVAAPRQRVRWERPAAIAAAALIAAIVSSGGTYWFLTKDTSPNEVAHIAANGDTPASLVAF